MVYFLFIAYSVLHPHDILSFPSLFSVVLSDLQCYSITKKNLNHFFFILCIKIPRTIHYVVGLLSRAKIIYDHNNVHLSGLIHIEFANYAYIIDCSIYYDIIINRLIEYIYISLVVGKHPLSFTLHLC